MNYKESKIILSEIEKAKKIVVNCHRSPDPDSIGSVLALKNVLKRMGKEVDIICPSEKLYPEVSFLESYNEIKNNINFGKFDFSGYDLFIVVDSSNWEMVTSNKKPFVPGIQTIVIDHHFTNSKYGLVNLIDKKASSAGEVMYRVFEDWNIKPDKDISTSLLAAIIGDTGLFRYPNSTDKTYEVVQKLIKIGADKELIVENLYRSNEFNLLKFWGEVLRGLKIDKKSRFVYSAVSYETYKKYGKPANAKDSACDLFAQSTKNTDFGIMAIETEKNILSVSFRARRDFNTSQIAVALGGGGHKAASGAKILGMSFDKALDLTLRMARKYAKKYSS